jgi:hypothetical protein
MNFKKIILWVVSVISILLIGGASYIYFNAQSIANNILREEIITKYNSSPQTQYTISLESVRLNLFTNSVKLINLKVTPKDSLNTLKRTIDGKLIRNTFIELHITEIYLKNFDYIKALTDRIVEAEKFEIVNPIIHIYQHNGEKIEKSEQQDTIDIRSIFLSNYDTFRIENIHINNASTYYHKVSTKMDTSDMFSLHNLSYQITGVVVNNSTLYSDEFFVFREYFLKSKDINAKLANGTTIDVGAINYSSKNRKLVISEFDLQPGLTPKQHFKTIKYRKGWVKLAIKKIEIDSIDIKNWAKTKDVYASKLTLNQPVLTLHSNANIPMDPKKVSPMLGDALKSLTLPFYIENIAIKDANIALDILGKITQEHGKMNFTKLNIDAENFTNIENEINKNKFLKIKATTKLNGTGNVKANITIDLKSKSSKTLFTLDAKKIDLQKFNSVLSPLLRIKITDGKMVSLKINSTLTSQNVNGTMDAYYKGLKILFESKDQNKKPGFFNNVVSGVANGVIKTENNPANKNYRKGQIKLDKLPSHSFFQLLWLTTLNGLEDSFIGSESRDNRKKHKIEREQSGKKKWSITKK